MKFSVIYDLLTREEFSRIKIIEKFNENFLIFIDGAYRIF